jgi:hypothetical protein
MSGGKRMRGDAGTRFKEVGAESAFESRPPRGHPLPHLPLGLDRRHPPLVLVLVLLDQPRRGVFWMFLNWRAVVKF